MSYHKAKYPKYKEKFSKKVLTTPILVKTGLKDNFIAFYLHYVGVFQKEFPKFANFIHSSCVYSTHLLYPGLFLSIGITTVNKTDKVHTLWEHTF